MKIIEAENVGVRYKLHHYKSKTLKANLFNILLRRKLYEKFWALRNVSFHVNKGEVFGIIGPNGSGKTTLLRVISDIFKIDEGEIKKEGGVSAILALGIGFKEELTGKDNIYLSGAFLGMSKKEIDERYDEIVEFSELEKFIDSPVKSYSYGMKARLSFSIAVSIEPDILLIDEILEVGDVTFSRKCQGKMKEMMGKASAILLVSHDIELVSKMCDRAMWLDKGKIVKIGNADDVTKEYLKSTNLNEK